MRPVAARRGVLSLTLVLFAGLLYAGSAGNGFVLDDGALVRDNPLIRSLTGIPTLFASDYWEPEAKVGLYRPLVTTSYALNYALGARAPRGYHLANIGLHALMSLLVWGLYLRLGSGAAIAATAAFLFAAHAVHTEAVANVTGRAELLGGIFFLLSLLAYLEGPGGRGRPGLYALSLGAYFLALLSKESAVTLLGVIPLYDLVHAQGRARSAAGSVGRLRARWPLYGGYVLVTGAYLGLRLLALAGQALPSPSAIDNPLVALDGPWRLLNALQVALRYAGLLLLPLHLSYDYSYDAIPLVSSLADPRGWGILVLSAALLGGLVWSYRASRELFFALAFLAVTFSVVSNLALPIGTIMAERLLYVPSVGFCLALALSVRAGCNKLGLKPKTTATLFVSVMALIVGLHGARTLARAADWSSNPRLYLHDVEVVPRSVKALGNAGKILQDRGQHRAAIERFEQAIEIEPGYRIPYINWAYSLSALGRSDEALALLEAQLQRDPPDPFAYNNLGFLLLEQGLDLVRGVALLEQANRLRPDDPDILDSLAWGYYKLGRHSEARGLLQRSLALNDWSASSAARRTHLETIERALRAR
ncbi:MAG: DUF1736 domain-containing protein [Deltaproteobacteria bacterium]|nr:MAG: DUF1736 domain-containing protein [Deltaproteobacteria bacterium]